MNEKINFSQKNESFEEVYNKSLEECVKVAIEFNSLIKQIENDLIKGDPIKQLYEKRGELVNSLNEHLLKRIELLHLLGIKKIEERINDIPKLKQAFQNMERSYLYQTSSEIRESITEPFGRGLVSLVSELNYSVGDVDWKNRRLDFKKGEKKYVLQYETKPSTSGIGGESRIVFLRIINESESDSGKKEICNYGGEWLQIPEDKEVQKEIDVLMATVG